MENNYNEVVETVGLLFDYIPCVNYAMLYNHIDACNTFILENKDEEDWHNIHIQIKGDYIVESNNYIDFLCLGKSFQLENIRIEPNINQLISFTETIETTFRLSIYTETKKLIEKEYPICLLTYDQWTGCLIMPELLSSFVIPNNPLLSKIIIEASKFMERWSGSPSMDEYQTQDRNRVRMQVASIYEALRSEGIIYSTVPASFQKYGQRIRLADKVLNEKLGNCIDTSLLFASCLEAIGIYPIIVILHRHAFVGAWLEPTVYPQKVCDDSSYLLKEAADGNNNIVLLESTAITSNEKISFEEAVSMAMMEIHNENNFELFVDVYRCRLENILPLPQRIKNDGDWDIIKNDSIEHSHNTNSFNELKHYSLKLDNTNVKITKQDIWERKLLDFTLRNNLLNTRLGKKIIPFMSFDIDHLEDHLQAGEDYRIICGPDRKINPNETGIYDSHQQALQYQKLVTEAIKEKKLISYLTDFELQDALKNIYRTSRTSLEENGANNLFLVLGLLKWFESPKSVQPRYAPLLLLPVSIIRRGGANSYVIRTREEEILLNITLVELLKQNFNISLDFLDPLPTDNSGVDVKLILTGIRRAIADMKRWNVLEESLLGLFSFNRFVMWNDIHSNMDKLKENTVISSLMENYIKWKPDNNLVDARKIDKTEEPKEFAIPLPVDSSQMEAIVESGRDKSFILYGPPGTGKSQTITNMISNALYQGKRVLFVAEKMAALTVVQSRLTKLNLDSFCLELHSNKATKNHFLDQMNKALNVARIKSAEEYASESEGLFNERLNLINYMESLHRKHKCGLSLYDCISSYLSIEGEEILEDLPDLEYISIDYIKKCERDIENIKLVLELIEHTPCQHPLYGLFLKDNSQIYINKLQFALEDAHKDEYNYVDKKKSFFKKFPFRLETNEDYKWLYEIRKLLSKFEIITYDLLQLGFMKEDLIVVKDNIDTGMQCNKQEKEITNSYNKSILTLEVQVNRNIWNNIQKKWFIPRFLAKRKYYKTLTYFGINKEDNIDEVFLKIEEYQSLRKDVNEIDKTLFKYFGKYVIKGHEDWNKVEYIINLLPEISKCISNYSYKHNIEPIEFIKTLIDKINNQWPNYKEDYFTWVDDLLALYTIRYNAYKKICDLIEINGDDNEQIYFINNHIEKWLTNFECVTDWYQWILKKQQLLNEKKSSMVKLLERGQENPDKILNMFLKGIYHKLRRRHFNCVMG